MRKAPALGALLTALALGACAGPHLVPDPESGIEYRWQNGTSTLDAAHAEADARCGPAGAMLASEFMDQDETLARFYCR